MFDRHTGWRQFARDRRGVTAMEYALIAALIAAVIIGGVTALGSRTNAIYQQVGSAAGAA